MAECFNHVAAVFLSWPEVLFPVANISSGEFLSAGGDRHMCCGVWRIFSAACEDKILPSKLCDPILCAIKLWERFNQFLCVANTVWNCEVD
jgi:hypothetical protein